MDVAGYMRASGEPTGRVDEKKKTSLQSEMPRLRRGNVF